MVKAYQNEVNNLLQLYIQNKHPVYVSYGDFCTFIPFWSRAMVVQDAKDIFKHVQKFNNPKLKLKAPHAAGINLTSELRTTNSKFKSAAVLASATR